MAAKPIAAFSWGYWGWGTAVPQFLKAASAAEAERGFAPPAFADIRFNRSVRAPGFREGALEVLVGADRYRWFKGLGNANIGTSSSRMRIAAPQDAQLLLDYVLEQAAANRRVLFFCACEMRDGVKCHRFLVANLLLAAARTRKTRLTVVEWPGGGPESRDVRIPFSAVKGPARTSGSEDPWTGVQALRDGPRILQGAMDAARP